MGKKILILCLLCSLLLSTASCGKPGFVDASSSLEFMNIPWNSTPEQVIEAMGFSEEDIESVDEPEGLQYGINARNVDVFGTTALTVRFIFHNYTEQEGVYGLASILVYFPDDSETDTAKLAEEITKTYGDGFEGLETYTHYVDAGGGQWIEEYAPVSGKAWVAEKTLADALPNSVKKNFKTFVMEREIYPYSESDVEDNLTNPIAELTWNTNSHPKMKDFPEGMSNVSLYYNAAEYVMMLQLFAQPYSE